MQKFNQGSYWKYIFALLASVFWGMSFVWSKIVFGYYSPLTTIFIRLFISSALLLIFWSLFLKKDRIRKEDWGWVFLSAFFQPFCYFIGESYGLKEVTSTVASVIIATIPVFSPLVAFLTLKEKITRLNIIGLLVSFTGVFVLILDKDFTLQVPLKGMLLLSFAVLSALFYSVLVRRLSQKYHPVTIVTFQNLMGTMLFLPFFLYFDLEHVIHTKPTFELIQSLLSLAVFASSLAFVSYTYALKHLGITRTNIFSNLIPVFTAVFSFVLLREWFTPAKIAGMMIVIFGVILTQLHSFKKFNK